MSTEDKVQGAKCEVRRRRQVVRVLSTADPSPPAQDEKYLMPSTMAWFFFVFIFEGTLVKKRDTQASVLKNCGV